MHDLTKFQRDILYITAARDDPKGLQIKADLEEYYQEDVNHGRLYPNLDELVDKGLMTKGEVDGRTNKYSLSPRGERALTARREWENEHFNFNAASD